MNKTKTNYGTVFWITGLSGAGKTTITKGKLNLGDNVPGYLKRTESSGKKEKKAILKK